MGEREALLRAVCEHPDDDTPRLVFADWLEENGQPERAEFIRVQIELARCSVTREESKTIKKLLKREQSLLTLWELRWRRDLPGDDGLHWGHFTRGFVESLEVNNSKLFFDNLAELFDETPLRHLDIACRFDLQRFVASPYFWRVHKLVLSPRSGIDSEGWSALAHCKSTDHIRLLMVAHKSSLDAELLMLQRRFGDRFALWGE